jgi:SAM-dependent methyltransferase
MARSVLGDRWYDRLRFRWNRLRRPLDWGSLRRTSPVSQVFGFDRGSPTDRYYIEAFLARFADDVRGRVLEIGDSTYTRRFGGDRVSMSDVLHVQPGHPRTTIVGDLSTGTNVPSDTYDCLVVTQTYQQIYDVRSAIAHSYRALKPGGILLATVPGISHIDPDAWEHWGDYWRFTSQSALRLFTEVFPSRGTIVLAYGNVLSAVAFLHGVASQELRRSELEKRDPYYEVTIGIRAVRPKAMLR